MESSSSWEVVTETRRKKGKDEPAHFREDEHGNLIQVTDELVEITDRLDVPGGWLYRSLTDDGTRERWVVAMAFVPEVSK